MIGFDLENIKRIKNIDKLLGKIANDSEIAYINKFKNKQEKVATLWTIKEAVFKAFDVMAGSFSYKDIELKHNENGTPIISLHGKAKEIFEDKGFKNIQISLSHTKDVVGAVVIFLK